MSIRTPFTIGGYTTTYLTIGQEDIYLWILNGYTFGGCSIWKETKNRLGTGSISFWIFETSNFISLKDDSKRHGESEFVERIGFNAWHIFRVRMDASLEEGDMLIVNGGIIEIVKTSRISIPFTLIEV